MTRKRKLVWTKRTPTKEGWVWYRDENRSAVLNVFDPGGNGYWKAWDWNGGRLQLCAIAEYTGEVVWTTGDAKRMIMPVDWPP
jgi:hypothetical protein